MSEVAVQTVGVDLPSHVGVTRSWIGARRWARFGGLIVTGCDGHGRVIVEPEEVDRDGDRLHVAFCDDPRTDSASIHVDPHHVIGIPAPEHRVEEPTVAGSVVVPGCGPVLIRIGGGLGRAAIDSDPNLGVRHHTTNFLHGLTVRQKEVVADGDRSWPVGDAGGEDPIPVTHHGRHPRLVLSDPVGGVLPEGTGHHARITSESVDRAPLGPSTFVLQCLRQVPVIQRHVRRYPTSPQPGDETPIEIETRLIHPSIAVGDDPWPRDRETVSRDPEIGEEVEILTHAMEVVAGDVTGITETPQVGEAIPYRVALSLLVPAALDLIRGSTDTPGEIVGKARVGFRVVAQTPGSLLVRRWRLPSAPIRP